MTSHAYMHQLKPYYCLFLSRTTLLDFAYSAGHSVHIVCAPIFYAEKLSHGRCSSWCALL